MRNPHNLFSDTLTWSFARFKFLFYLLTYLLKQSSPFVHGIHTACTFTYFICHSV